ncbi:MAG: ankyrin repeat domain-containing protein [Brevinema sp.]
MVSSALFSQQTPDTSRFSRLSYQKLTNLASPSRLSHRIFYNSPSRGADARWFDAVKEGNLALVRQMVENGQNIEAKDNSSLGQTALGWAAFIGYLDIAQYLISKGADLYATDRADVAHALKSAILGGDIAMIRYLFPLYKGKLDLNAQDERDGETALMVAAGNGRVDAVKFLLEQKVDVKIVSKQLNRNAFSYACQEGNREILDLITKAGGVNLQTGEPTCR